MKLPIVAALLYVTATYVPIGVKLYSITDSVDRGWKALLVIALVFPLILLCIAIRGFDDRGAIERLSKAFFLNIAICAAAFWTPLAIGSMLFSDVFAFRDSGVRSVWIISAVVWWISPSIVRFKEKKTG